MMRLSIVSGLKESKSKQEKINEKFTNLCEFLKPLNFKGIELSLLEPEKIEVKEIPKREKINITSSLKECCRVKNQV